MALHWWNNLQGKKAVLFLLGSAMHRAEKCFLRVSQFHSVEFRLITSHEGRDYGLSPLRRDLVLVSSRPCVFFRGHQFPSWVPEAGVNLLLESTVEKHLEQATLYEVQLQPTTRYHLAPVRMAIIQKSTNSKCWRGCGEERTLLQCCWECKLAQQLQPTVQRYLRNLHIERSYDPSVPLLGI